ncbi:MAG: formylglycine-generating enzyme family protein [bacterium]
MKRSCSQRSGSSVLREIPGGVFLIGENDDDKFANDTERPRHSVDVPAFRMGATPVTIGEFRLFRPDHEPNLPPEWPAVWVSWDDAVAYCAWLGPGFRLPTEVEWEYAARAGSQKPYPWGDTITPEQANYLHNEQGAKIGPGHRTPVGAYPPNAFGLFDMLGNVCEWVRDLWRPDYQTGPQVNETRRVLRGGAWDYLPRLLRCSWRDALAHDTRRDNVGFRIAADA